MASGRAGQHGAVGALTLVGLFAVILPEKVSVTCQGAISEEFEEVLDALPSQQAREIATSAVFRGVKVGLEYDPVGLVEITVFERDGTRQVSRLKWS